MADQIVVGATRKDLIITIQDDTGANVNITGGTVALTGSSLDLPSKTLNVTGTITDGPNGVCKFASIGGTSFVTSGDMGAKKLATFDCRVKFTDSGAKIDYGPSFQLQWVMPAA